MGATSVPESGKAREPVRLSRGPAGTTARHASGERVPVAGKPFLAGLFWGGGAGPGRWRGPGEKVRIRTGRVTFSRLPPERGGPSFAG